MAEVEVKQHDYEAAPQQADTKISFKDLVETALSDYKLDKTELENILKRYDTEKWQIKWDTAKKLQTYLKTEYSEILKTTKDKDWVDWNAWEKTKKALEAALAKANVKVDTVVSAQQPPAPAKSETVKAEPAKQTWWVVEWTKSFFTKAKDWVTWLFKSEVDLTKIPEKDKLTINELQKAWFKLKVVEWKESTYEVDMNWLFDKSVLKIEKDLTIKFTTDTIKDKSGKVKEFSFYDVIEAKSKLPKINEYINLQYEIDRIESQSEKTIMDGNDLPEKQTKIVKLWTDLGIEKK